MWKKQSKFAAIWSPLISSAAALIAWFVQTHVEYHHISITTLSGNLPLVAGNMMSLCGPIVMTPLLTYIKPDNYDWELLKDIKQADDADDGTSSVTEPKHEETGLTAREAEEVEHGRVLLKARTKALIVSIVLTLCYLILWPIPMYGTRYVFSRGFFKGWIVVVFLWAWYAALTITLLPIWEGRRSIMAFFVFIFSSKRKRHQEGTVANALFTQGEPVNNEVDPSGTETPGSNTGLEEKKAVGGETKEL